MRVHLHFDNAGRPSARVLSQNASIPVYPSAAIPQGPACNRAPNRWFRRNATPSHGPGADLSPEDLMRQLAAEHGVRLWSPSARTAQAADVHGGQQTQHQQRQQPRYEDYDNFGYDYDEDEEESWEEAVADLGNPWDMRPGRVDPFEDDQDGLRVGVADSQLRPPASPASPSPSGPSVSPYLDPSAIPRIGRGELRELAAVGQQERHQQQHERHQHGGGGGGGDARGAVGMAAIPAAAADSKAEVEAESSGRGRVVVVDVREVGEEAEAEAEEGVPCLRIPLSSLRRPQAERLEGGWDYVAVRALAGEAGDLRAEQAVVRLTKVYGLRRVVLYDENVE